MMILNRIMYFMSVIFGWLKHIWESIGLLIMTNSLLSEIISILGLLIISVIIINLVINIFDRFS